MGSGLAIQQFAREPQYCRNADPTPSVPPTFLRAFCRTCNLRCLMYKDAVAGAVAPANRKGVTVGTRVPCPDNVAAILHGNTATTEAVMPLRRSLVPLDASIRPLHPHNQDRALTGRFAMEVSNRCNVDLVETRSLPLPTVLAAYAMPEAELP